MTSNRKIKPSAEPLPAGYPEFLESLKARIRQTQVHAFLSVNRELMLLYWLIGKEILQCQEQQGWGAKMIDRLAKDLKRDFPEINGFSPRNHKYMRAFAEAWSDEQIVQQVVAQFPWGHNCVMLEKVKTREERIWHIQQTIQHGWSRNILVHQIETQLYHRQGKAITNFKHTLPVPQSDLARSLLKDPYMFDFLSLGAEAQERDLERALIERLRDFLLELGKGFAFVGSQYHLEVGGEDFYLDMLFYQLRLRCYLMIDLKIDQFQPEYAGKINFYLSAVDDLLYLPEDRPSIGLILCKNQNHLIAEYALHNLSKSMGVATYCLTKAMPEELQKNLPSIDELKKELGYGR